LKVLDATPTRPHLTSLTPFFACQFCLPVLPHRPSLPVTFPGDSWPSGGRLLSLGCVPFQRQEKPCDGSAGTNTTNFTWSLNSENRLLLAGSGFLLMVSALFLPPLPSCLQSCLSSACGPRTQLLHCDHAHAVDVSAGTRG
jgi:hypothetical protein